MKIAIVGSGISGLTVAHLLHKRHEITVFEAAPYVGGHTHTVRVDMPDETHHVDTGFIVFNDRNYPNFERLLHEIRVAWQTSEMSFSVSDSAGAFEYASGSPNGLFAKCPRFGRPTHARCGAFRPGSWPSFSPTTACSAFAAGHAGERSGAARLGM